MATNNATPRNLDPKFKDETQETEEQRTAREADEADEAKKQDETPMIVSRQQIVNPDGTVGEKVHGPMPVADWPAYEKEHNL